MTAMETNIDRLGKPAGEKEGIVYSLRHSSIIVTFRVTRL